MINLNELNIWKKLTSPYGNSEDIPSLILELSKTEKKEIADELVWEYIYHQGSIYENTLATTPHLLKIISESDDNNFKLDIISSLGVVFIDIDENYNFNNFFEESAVNNIVKNRIKLAFLESLKEFRIIVESLFNSLNNLNEESKIFFLIAALVSQKKHQEAELFKTFNQNDEYVFTCTSCKEETFLWNEENTLNAYKEDPIFNKKQKTIKVSQSNSSTKLKWLEDLINKINISSLKPLLPYFKGNILCHNCSKETNIFNGIMKSIYN